MKQLVISTLTLFCLSTISFAETKMETGKFNVDVSHSKVGFGISHLVISTVDGTFKTFEGTIDLNPDFTKSTVTAKINVDSIETANADRDKHLKSPDFFDVKKFPTMTFQSKSIKGTPEAFTMEGELDMHGTKKLVTLEGKYMGAVKGPDGNTRIAVNAKGKLSRKDFGLKWTKMIEAGPVVGDEVTLDLKVEAIKAK